MTRILIHAGFHKTGTTSLQNHLARHRKRLAPYFTYYGANDFKNAGARARIYAQRPFPHRLLRFRLAFRRFLRSVPADDVIVLSRETFCGVMPGHRDWRGRTLQDFAPAAVPLLTVTLQELHRRFPDARVELLFTTRDREAWVRSVYGHLLRSIHLTETFEEFRALFPDLIDLREEAQRIHAALPGRLPLHITPMEDYADHRHGPAGAVLDLLEVPQALQDSLAPARRANQGQSKALEAAFFRLNHAGHSKRALKRMKDHMLDTAAQTPPAKDTPKA